MRLSTIWMMMYRFPTMMREPLRLCPNTFIRLHSCGFSSSITNVKGSYNTMTNILETINDHNVRFQNCDVLNRSDDWWVPVQDRSGNMVHNLSELSGNKYMCNNSKRISALNGNRQGRSLTLTLQGCAMNRPSWLMGIIRNLTTSRKVDSSAADDSSELLLSTPSGLVSTRSGSAGRTWVLQFDGGSRGNPGLGGSGSVLYCCDYAVDADTADEVLLNQEVWHRYHYLGGEGVTNNAAEYQGLIEGLQEAVRLGLRSLLVQGDSQLVIRQLQGVYKVRNPRLQELHATATSLLRQIPEYTLAHIPRDRNGRADELSNMAMDRRESCDWSEEEEEEEEEEENCGQSDGENCEPLSADRVANSTVTDSESCHVSRGGSCRAQSQD